MRDVNTEKSPTISQLRGKRILITGATGFLGKVVLEKLIRTVPDIEAVYLLMRGNRSYRDVRERFEKEIVASSIFDTLRERDAAWFEAFCANRIHWVSGEATETHFGMSRTAFLTLAGELDGIINSAASVNFREELDKALAINTFSLRNIIELAEAAGNIPVIQVSTCSVNGFNQGSMREGAVSPARAQVPSQHER